MIVDFHTHIFPPDVRQRREEYIRRDPTFAEMYANPRAKIATAEELLHSMEECGVDVSVALGFAWREHELCRRHNDYLLESAANSGGRIVPFCTVNMLADLAAVTKEVARCTAAGARGLGELRPESQGWDLNGEPGERLAALAARWSLVLLFHVTEPIGHDYPGKQGLRLDSFYKFAAAHPKLKIVGAHLGGGLPFLNRLEYQMATWSENVCVDTAAWNLIYRSYRNILALLHAWGPARTLFGSDFPLVTQASARRLIERSKKEARHLPIWGARRFDYELRYVLGDNARVLLGLGTRWDRIGTSDRQDPAQ